MLNDTICDKRNTILKSKQAPEVVYGCAHKHELELDGIYILDDAS